MDFSLDNLGFLATANVSQVASQGSETSPSPSGSGSSASVSSSGASPRRNCPQCRRRMSTTIFDRHTVCLKCRAWDCFVDKRCGEFLNWSQEEMESYVKHRKLIVSKDKKGKDSLPKLPSSPGPVQPSAPSVSLSVTDVDNHISSQLSEISASFDRKLQALQAFLVNNISSMHNLDPVSMSARLSR